MVFLIAQRRLSLFVCFFCLFSCKANNDFLNTRQKAIQLNVDSAETLYLTAISEYHRGELADSIEKKYLPKRDAIQGHINLILDTINSKCMAGEFRGDQCDEFMKNISTGKVKRLQDSLRKLGVNL